jgi:hypothetical protein
MQALATATGTPRYDDEAPALDWLERMGVVTFDDQGTWKLTDFGSAAMARYYRTSAPMPPPRMSRDRGRAVPLAARHRA